jgi:hypothetical protein
MLEQEKRGELPLPATLESSTKKAHAYELSGTVMRSYEKVGDHWEEKIEYAPSEIRSSAN